MADDDQEPVEFQWDEGNLRHLLITSPHGVTPELCYRLRDDEPRFFAARQGPTRSASHMMIAQDEDGRIWTVIVDSRDTNLWRPVTGWPSTNSEIRLYRQVDSDE